MPLKIYSAPAAEPISASEAKLHLRVDHSTEDTYIGVLITAARETVETITRRALISQTWDLFLDSFPAQFVIPFAPLVSVTGVYYTPDGGTELTLASANYVVDIYNEPGKILLSSSGSWPTNTLIPANGVRVRFVCGYGAAGTNVPANLRQAMLLLIGDMYEHREGMTVGAVARELPRGINELLWPYRVYRYV